MANEVSHAQREELHAAIAVVSDRLALARDAFFCDAVSRAFVAHEFRCAALRLVAFAAYLEGNAPRAAV
jgi:hypothetical protein